MDDWQETQLTNRHVHNRVGKGSKRQGGGKSGGAFDVKRVLGTYDVKCSAAGKLSTADSDQEASRKLEVYTLNEKGNAIIGELILGGVLHASVLLAGSRKTMNSVVRDLEAANEEAEEEEEEQGAEDDVQGTGEKVDSKHGDDEDDAEDDSDEDEDDDEDSTANQRFREFEKNSFRVPKFWVRWQGSLLSQATGSDSSIPERSVTGTGYFVFTGNHCQKFNGTLSCESLDWDNVKITGMKLRGHPARDFALTWRTE